MPRLPGPADSDYGPNGSDPRQVAYEDALRGIALATVTARRTPHNLAALQTMLTDVEHHLSSLIALGYVPRDSGRPVTSSAHPDDRPALP